MLHSFVTASVQLHTDAAVYLTSSQTVVYRKLKVNRSTESHSCESDFGYMSFNLVNNIYMLGAHLIYVTLFSSNMYMLVIYIHFMIFFLQKNIHLLL